MIELFCGFDQREAIGFHVFAASVIKRASKPVRITPLASMGLPEGSNSFTVSRFLVPHLMDFKGRAIFADACDMLMLGDVADLDALFDPTYAVQVVKHPTYESQHARKYVGTEMECEQSNYGRKNWASLMLVNAEHAAWRVMTPEWLGCTEEQAIETGVKATNALELLQFSDFSPEEIGQLPAEWNVLIDEGQPREGAKLLHWTAGIPTFKHYRNARASKDWFAEFEELTGGTE